MGVIKETFYQELQEDYRISGSDSVIYQFLKEERERMLKQFQELSGKKGTDAKAKESKLPYPVLLQYHFRSLLLGTETPEQYISSLFRILSKGRIPWQNASAETFSILDELLTVCSDSEKYGLSLSKKLKAIVSRLDSDSAGVLKKFSESSYARKPYQKLEILTEGLLDCAVHKGVKDFFYDVGCPYREREQTKEYGALQTPPGAGKKKASTGRQAKAKSKREPRVDKTLNLLDAYYERNPGSLPHAQELDAEECARLFRQLASGCNQEVLVPLYVDRLTGCALYIVGKSYYEALYVRASAAKKKQFEDNPDACAYGILQFSEDSREDSSVGYLLSGWFDELSDIDIALEEYKLACRDAMEDLRQYNRALPSGCPSILMQYSLGNPERISPSELEAERLLELEEFEKL